MKKKVGCSPQIGGVMVSHHNMVLPQNGDTRAGRPPSDATGSGWEKLPSY